jgi:redox-sensitive bicupin YhaK (pirin superfamily)
MDQMGEVNYVPGEPKGTHWHRHRGFETVTYMIDGVFRHQDSNGGGGGLITDGDTQWMTAAPGHGGLISNRRAERRAIAHLRRSHRSVNATRMG